MFVRPVLLESGDWVIAKKKDGGGLERFFIPKWAGDALYNDGVNKVDHQERLKRRTKRQ